MASNCAPPIPNPDISGIGVRVSFYLQYTLAVLSCTLSQENRDVEDALSTLAVTNMAYCVTTLVLGFKSPPELTLYDGLIVIYLTCFTLGFCYAITLLYAQTKGFHRHIYLLACIQCYLVLGTFLAICVTMPSFGSDAPCNHERRSSIFFIPVSMRTFRITGLVMTIFFLAFGTISMIYNNWFRRGKRGERPRYSDKKVLARFVTNTVVFGLCIAHVETLRLYNKPDPADQSWGFGQILPVFLIALPAMRTLSLLRHHLAPWMWPSRSVAKRSLLSTSRSDEETLAGHASLGRSSPGEISAPTTTGASLPSGSIMIPLQEHPSRVWAESSSLLVADKMAGSTVLDKSF